MQLKGNNLCLRQHELNTKVNEATEKKIDFNVIKSEQETSDVDRIFKIDFASKNRVIDYIIESLKSGDSLYATRAMKKSIWLYDDEFMHFVNPDFLHHNIFPSMSLKIMKKFLTTISVHLANEERASDFHTYCVNMRLPSFADKFLIKTSLTYKLKNLQNVKDFNDIRRLKYIIGNSFELLNLYLENQSEWNTDRIIRSFSYLYSISNSQYLDLLEIHAKIDLNRTKTLGIRISKDIVTKNRNRVFMKLKFYLNLLNKSQIIRHSTVDDVKLFIENLMPEKVEEFWRLNFLKRYSFFICALPKEERFQTVKNCFTIHYPSQEFEMTKEFYIQEYHSIMSLTELEAWALKHIADEKEILGKGRDYVWYRFVSYEKAFAGINRYIKITKDSVKRNDQVKILIESARDTKDIEELLKYYYKRHNNESNNEKEKFLKKIMHYFKVYEFNTSCWAAFDKLLYSLEVYNNSEKPVFPEFKAVSLMYHIINLKNLPDAIIKYLDIGMSTYTLKPYVDKFNIEQKNVVFEYITDHYLKRITQFYPLPTDPEKLKEALEKVSVFIYFYLEFLAIYKKCKNDVPESVMNIVNSDWETYKYQQIFQDKDEHHAYQIYEEDFLLKCLKKDTKLIVDDMENAVCNNYTQRIRKFLKKINIYFAHDISQDLLNLYIKVLSQDSYYKILSAVFAIFQLSPLQYKIEFMNKYVPETDKIDRSISKSATFYIQEGICRFACYSRPPVPLKTMLLYLKGDYVRFCLPMFNMYLSNLTQKSTLEFVESIINTPVSIQKHGLRLAFKCFNEDNLIKLILESWKNTKNVTLRCIIYKAFYDKTIMENSRQLFEVLKKLTSDLGEDDDEEIYAIVTSRKLPQEFIGEFYETIWKTVDKLTNKQTHLDRKKQIIRSIDNNMNSINKDATKGIVEEFVKDLFRTDKDNDYDINGIDKVKWTFIAHYIVLFTKLDSDRLESIELTKIIFKNIVERWNVDVLDCYVYQQLCVDLINELNSPYCFYDNNLENTVPIFEAILEELLMLLPLSDVYIIIWQLKLIVIYRKLIQTGREEAVRDELIAIHKSSENFGKEIANLVQEFLEKNIYFARFEIKIAEMIVYCTHNIDLFISGTFGDKSYNNELVSVARGILNLEKTETYILALNVLPLNPKGTNVEAYMEVVQKIRNNSNLEVQCCFRNKFYKDFKKSSFI